MPLRLPRLLPFRLPALLRALGFAAALAAFGSDTACAQPIPEQPEAATGWQPKPGWVVRRQAVAAAHPLAAEAGYQVLREGGSAIDAAVAVQMVLTLVEPQSSGIGGGAFLLHYDGRAVQAYDGRETAPAAAGEDLFLDPSGKPLPFYAAAIGGRAVGVPGVLRLLEAAHREHGRLPWARLFEPAIALAENGFEVGPRLANLLARDAHLRRDPEAAAYFYDTAGQPWPAGHRLRNPALAATLRAIAAGGARVFYEGELAQAIVDKVQRHPTNPGRLSLADLAAYRPRPREPLCHDHPAQARDWRLCGFPPPSSGAIAIGQILGLLTHTRAPGLGLQDGLPSADWLHLYTEASRLAYADRAQYLADPDFVAPPAGRWSSLLDPAYLSGRARLIGQAPGAPSMKSARPGTPGGGAAPRAPMAEQPENGTSHISIVDDRGHAVAMTTSIEDAFGARQMVRGFLLNNQLTDFSFAPADAAGRPVANRVQPGKRPRSSMAPTLVFDGATGRLVLVGGSPGGALIIPYMTKLLWGVLHWGLTPQQAIDLPNMGSLGGPSLLEERRFPPATVQALRARGAVVREIPMTSGLHALGRDTVEGEAVWRGGADPRREGVVRGD